MRSTSEIHAPVSSVEPAVGTEVRPLTKHERGTHKRRSPRRLRRADDHHRRELRAHPRAERHRRVAERDRVARRRRRHQGRRHGGGRRGRHGVRARRHASDRRQHRRRRLHGLPAGQRPGGDVRLPREGARESVADDVAEGRSVQLRASSQQPSGGRRAGHGRRPPPRVEGTGQAAVEAPRRAGGRARARRLHRQRQASRDRSRARSGRCRSIRRRWRRSRRPACRTKRAKR